MKIKLISTALLLAVGLCGAETVIHKVGIKENLKFLDEGRPERMDLYYPADPQPGEKFPGIVIIHGGGWVSGIRNAAREVNIGSNLARMGYVAISIDYRLATAGNVKKYGKIYPVNVQDCKTAVQWLRKNAEKLNIDPAKIGCIGGSAGGHLSAMLAVAGPEVGLEPQSPFPGVDSSVQACINLYGVMDFSRVFVPAPKKSFGQGRINVMGSTPETDPENWRKMSPIQLVDPKDPPMLQIHGKADTTVDYRQSIMMKEVLDKAGVKNELILVDGIGHVFNMQYWRGKPIPKMVRQRILAFYDRYLKGLSDEQAAERFAALEAWEKAHPEAAYYGISSEVDGEIKSCSKKQMTAEFENGTRVYQFSSAPLVAVETLTPSGLADGKTVEVHGRKQENKTFLCRRVILIADSRIGKTRGSGKTEVIRGIARKTDSGWKLDCGREGVFQLDIGPASQIFIRSKGSWADIKVGADVKFVSARDYGDCRKILLIVIGK
ncbi:MAG: alpha/beta hydrolase [Lentisphaeria bacterium]|nr:alpha/beta hydrolase [Lentisphaeria bacterium]